MASTTTLSHSRIGNSLRPSERVVAHPCSIQTDRPSLETSLTVLMAMLQCLTKNTNSGDILFISIIGAKRICTELGVPSDDFEKVIQWYKESAAQLRTSNPMAWD